MSKATRRNTNPAPSPAPAELAADAGARDDIYNLEKAARRCGVSVKQVLDWIDLGLRAFPVGESIKYRARDYIILEEWLMDFFRSRGGVVRRADGDGKGKDGARRKEPPASQPNRDQPLGPRPY